MAKETNKSEKLIKSKHTMARIAPRKVVLVANAIRGMKIDDAIRFLTFNNQKSSGIIKNVVESAIANGIHNFGAEKGNLYVSDIRIGPGPIRKGGRPGSRGVFKPIWKRTTHITVILGSQAEAQAEGPKAVNKEESK